MIPQEILKSLNLQAWDCVAFERRGDSIVIKPKMKVDSEDVLTPAEEALLKKAEREMKQGKFVTLAELEYDLERKGSPGRRKTA